MYGKTYHSTVIVYVTSLAVLFKSTNFFGIKSSIEFVIRHGSIFALYPYRILLAFKMMTITQFSKSFLDAIAVLNEL